MKQAAFFFNPYPFRYFAKYKSQDTDSTWKEEVEELANLGTEESQVSKERRAELAEERNYTGNFPMVNFSSQYGLSCFEGLKAYPQADGSFALFRPEKNAERFHTSMKALYMPPFPVEQFLTATKKLILLSRDKGFFPRYDAEWEKNHFSTALAMYIRPFTYPEGGLGLNISENPWVLMYISEVGNYLDIEEVPSLVTSEKIRATPHGTGAVKCSSNYVISILAKKDAKKAGFTEALFLDMERKHIEECSSCNVFFVLNDNTIVTPPLGDTILPGITRDSAITLARDAGHTVVERKISIEEVFDNTKECFASGTAVGVEHFGKLTHKGKLKTFGDGTVGPVATYLQTTLKRIQYGLQEDKHDWLIPV